MDKRPTNLLSGDPRRGAAVVQGASPGSGDFSLCHRCFWLVMQKMSVLLVMTSPLAELRPVPAWVSIQWDTSILDCPKAVVTKSDPYCI